MRLCCAFELPIVVEQIPGANWRKCVHQKGVPNHRAQPMRLQRRYAFFSIASDSPYPHPSKKVPPPELSYKTLPISFVIPIVLYGSFFVKRETDTLHRIANFVSLGRVIAMDIERWMTRYNQKTS